MDDRFTESIKVWLDTPADARDIAAGALLLLRINRNRILYENILRKPEKLASKLEYELRKHYRIRLERLTLDQVAAMEREVLPAVRQTVEAPAPDSAGAPGQGQEGGPFRGRRADHDLLPEDVRREYELNGERFRKMRQLYHTLMGMMHLQPCDRHELLTQLADLDRSYHAAWERYDLAQPVPEGGEAPAPSPEPAAPPTAAQVSAARKYIALNRTRLDKLDAETEEAGALRDELARRVAIVVASGGGFKTEVVEHLRTHHVPLPEVLMPAAPETAPEPAEEPAETPEPAPAEE